MAGMSIDPDLNIVPWSADRPLVVSRSWNGFAIEQARIDDVDGFGFSRSGNSHYLALHDILLDDGEAQITDGPTSDLKNLRETITFLPAGAEIKGWSKPAGKTNGFTALYFDPDLLGTEIEGAYRDTALPPILYGRSHQLGLTMSKLGQMDLYSPGANLIAEQLCIVAALETLQLGAAFVAPKTGTLSVEQLRRVKDFVESHISADIGLSELADVAGLSRFHFVRAFRQSTGETPYAFLTKARVERAKHLLVKTSETVSMIALSSGFRDERQLRRAMTKLTGLTPLDFRRQS